MTSTSLPEWDLSDFYSSFTDPQIAKDIAVATELAEGFASRYKDKITELNAAGLAQAIEDYSAIEELLGKLGSYAYLLYAANMSEEEHARFYQHIQESLNDISIHTLFFSLEINKIDEAVLQTMLNDSAALARYQPWLRDVRAFTPYQLSDELETLLHEKDVSSRQAWQRLFDETLAELSFPFQGKEVTTTEIMDYLSSHNPEERKEAGKSLGNTLGQHSKTFTFITNILAKDKSIADKWRRFPAPISSRNVSNFIEDDVVTTLIGSVKNNYANLAHRYYRIKAGWFGKDSLDYWDRNAPLPDAGEERIPWDEAVELILSAYTDFSPEIGAIGRRFFDNAWIDAAIRKGKDSGAFAHPTVPSVHPYLLVNYQGKTRDVMTLAHELGHGVHQVLSGKQGVLMSDTPLTLAETASVFGEQLTFQALLKREADEKKRKIIIAGKVEDMLNTVVRQVAFCEFERMVHDERKQGELSSDRLGELWLQVQKESLGDAIRFHDEYKYYWSYIPHFIHSPFYVYAYAFGDCLVNALYAAYQQQPEGFAEKYLAMLEAGGTLRHKELLAPFDLDATDPAFWQKGLDIISGFIDELE